MAGFFSKFKTVSKSEKKINSPVTAPNKNRKYTGSSRKRWISGSLFILILLLYVSFLSYHLKQTRQNATRLEVTARMQTHHQRLPRILQLAFSGRKTAFTQIQDSQKQINQYMALLSNGGYFRQNYVEPITQEHLLVLLEDLITKWHPEEEKIHLLLSNKQMLISLGQAINEMNSTSRELHQKIGQLIDRFTQVGNLSNEHAAVTTMQTLAQNVTRSVNILLSSKLPVSEIKKQLTHDRKQFSAILQAFNQGHNILNLSAIKDHDVQEILPQIKSLFIKIDNNINTIQTEISDIMTAKIAASETIQKSEMIWNNVAALDQALQVHHADQTDLLAKVHYGFIIGAALSLLAFLYTLRNNKYDQPQISTYPMADTQKAMLQLLDDMKKMADGDLTVRTVVTGDITGAIADAVNYTIEELHSLVEQVNKASAQVVNASSQAQHVSTELLAAAQQQSHKIEETTVAVLGMAESISVVSDTAAESTEVAKQSLITAEKGNTAVHESIAGMDKIRTHIQETSKRIKRLGESSQEIGEIVALVSDITEQTNILALNAALQATAAGEAGRGFSKIAQEVQRLAERSAEAGKQISRLIKTIQSDTYDAIAAMERSTLEVTKGTQRSNIAGSALEEIETVSRRLADHVTNIYDTTHAQTQAANKVIENMEEILHITRQTTHGTQQTTASVKQISGFASELKASVSSFKI
ncbi:methyl-accepting chemotaxis protein [Nitrosomonas sp.]|uniref:methyl-accepting chemotaxis protein n=1 Tax=Nitrosomonas sp. TaxID=42353 RepID=UPI002088B29F|nr:methyl-accepting chemotaxis protein [Nitrosomonas sp.]GJL74807.1 MAG: protein PilJ [Nitrosomonas sp.]